MRVTVSHNKPVDQVKGAVDRSFDDLFRAPIGIPVKVVNEKREWRGSTLFFSFTAKMGILSSPISGTVEVTVRDLTIDADLGLLEKLIPGGAAKTAIEQNVRGLLT